MDKIYFLILASNIATFFCGCVFTFIVEKYNDER
jgi:hypothetical protein